VLVLRHIDGLKAIRNLYSSDVNIRAVPLLFTLRFVCFLVGNTLDAFRVPMRLLVLLSARAVQLLTTKRRAASRAARHALLAATVPRPGLLR
jgi:hypothetical protein